MIGALGVNLVFSAIQNLITTETILRRICPLNVSALGQEATSAEVPSLWCPSSGANGAFEINRFQPSMSCESKVVIRSLKVKIVPLIFYFGPITCLDPLSACAHFNTYCNNPLDSKGRLGGWNRMSEDPPWDTAPCNSAGSKRTISFSRCPSSCRPWRTRPGRSAWALSCGHDGRGPDSSLTWKKHFNHYGAFSSIHT